MSATWIRFERIGDSASGKTRMWRVMANSGGDLGTIKWFGRWRCYAFYPDGATVYERKCLRDIADFCEEETRSRKKK